MTSNYWNRHSPSDDVALVLKEWDDQIDNVNSTKSITVLRVSQTDINNLFLMFTDIKSDYEISKLNDTRAVVYNTNITAPFEKTSYIWSGTKWVRNILVNNGLSMNQNTVKIGGNLIQNSVINQGCYDLDFFNPASEFRFVIAITVL